MSRERESLMLKSVYAEHDGKTVIIVDLGYLTGTGIGSDPMDPEVDARFRAMKAFGIGKKNFRLEANWRLMVEIPAAKLDLLMKALPIVQGETYWRATHHWRGLKKGERKAVAPVL